MTRSLLVGIAAFALLSGCAHSAPAATAPMGHDHGGKMAAMCPMGVPGTQVSSIDEVDGSTMTFTAPDQVPELRRRVQAMAEMHNRHHAGGGMHEEKEGGGMMGGMMGGGKEMGGMMMPPSHATVVEVENGASMKLTPNDPADLQKLRDAARMHVERMQQHGCEMMGEKHRS
jgi:hypothetical protein